MGKFRVLHLEDSDADAFFVRRTLEHFHIDAEFMLAESAKAFRDALATGPPDLILSDSNVPGFNGLEAMQLARQHYPQVPFIFVSGSSDEREILARLDAGATDYVMKDQSWQLISAVRRVAFNHRSADTGRGGRAAAATESDSEVPVAKLTEQGLIEVVQQLSFARSLEAVMEIVRKAARRLTGADGATFVLRDGDKCFYAEEDAISPLWKGQRFPLTSCISGWAMLNRQSAVIEDIYADPRIPAEAYRPTFVKSLAMVPIRTAHPIGAIGNYWAERRQPTEHEVEVLQALANATSLAMENIQVYSELEQRIAARTAELTRANRELEAFSYSVSHDLRAPLRAVSGYAELLAEDLEEDPDGPLRTFVERIRREARHMNSIIEDLTRLARISRNELRLAPLDLSDIARQIAARLHSNEPQRQVQWEIEPDVQAEADEGLLRVVLENLLSNAWKYSSKEPQARISFTVETSPDSTPVYCVRDNGAGFDLASASKLFTAFQRMHSASEFPGTGVGLATVQRVIERHGGRIWAEAAVDAGAAFFFTLAAGSPGENRL